MALKMVTRSINIFELLFVSLELDHWVFEEGAGDMVQAQFFSLFFHAVGIFSGHVYSMHYIFSSL